MEYPGNGTLSEHAKLEIVFLHSVRVQGSRILAIHSIAIGTVVSYQNVFLCVTFLVDVCKFIVLFYVQRTRNQRRDVDVN